MRRTYKLELDIVGMKITGKEEEMFPIEDLVTHTESVGDQR